MLVVGVQDGTSTLPAKRWRPHVAEVQAMLAWLEMRHKAGGRRHGRILPK
jgi:hypothetical protein